MFLCVDSASPLQLPMHEVTFSTIDKPKLLSQVHICHWALGILALESAASVKILLNYCLMNGRTVSEA